MRLGYVEKNELANKLKMIYVRYPISHKEIRLIHSPCNKFHLELHRVDVLLQAEVHSARRPMIFEIPGESADGSERLIEKLVTFRIGQFGDELSESIEHRAIHVVFVWIEAYAIEGFIGK